MHECASWRDPGVVPSGQSSEPCLSSVPSNFVQTLSLMRKHLVSTPPGARLLQGHGSQLLACTVDPPWTQCPLEASGSRSSELCLRIVGAVICPVVQGGCKAMGGATQTTARAAGDTVAVTEWWSQSVAVATPCWLIGAC